MKGTPNFIKKAAGTYALIMQLPRTRAVTVGRLGPVKFAAGSYVYVGSAFGPGGLAARIGRHLKPAKKCHWHIDYLRRFAEIWEIWYTLQPDKVECKWAGHIGQMRGARTPCPGFGSTDCRCRSHLLYFKAAPGFGAFCKQTVTPIRAVKLLVMNGNRIQTGQ